MTIEPTTSAVTPSDRRRAAVLLTHAAGGDAEGALAVLAEAGAAGVTGLLAGLVEVVLTIVPPLSTPEGVEHLRRVAAGYAHAEHIGDRA